MSNNLLRNGSGYLDPTAYKAIKNVDNEKKKETNGFGYVTCSGAGKRSTMSMIDEFMTGIEPLPLDGEVNYD